MVFNFLGAVLRVLAAIRATVHMIQGVVRDGHEVAIVAVDEVLGVVGFLVYVTDKRAQAFQLELVDVVRGEDASNHPQP